MNLPRSQICGDARRWHVYWKGDWIATMFSRGDAQWLLRRQRWLSAGRVGADAELGSPE
jgi:hypothetical protein